MPRERDAKVPEGWRKCEHLPQFIVCPRCGAVCDQDGVSVHDKWHDSVENRFSSLTEMMEIVGERLGLV